MCSWRIRRSRTSPPRGDRRVATARAVGRQSPAKAPPEPSSPLINEVGGGARFARTRLRKPPSAAPLLSPTPRPPFTSPYGSRRRSLRRANRNRAGQRVSLSPKLRLLWFVPLPPFLGATRSSSFSMRNRFGITTIRRGTATSFGSRGRCRPGWRPNVRFGGDRRECDRGLSAVPDGAAGGTGPPGQAVPLPLPAGRQG